MYQFDFVRVDGEAEFVLSVLAPNYEQAVKKARMLKLPDFDLTEYILEGVYEVGAIIPSN
jgi:hypothetical protein